AQVQLSAARETAVEVLQEGEALARNLHELGRSLEANAHHLLNDVRASHAALIATLDRVALPRQTTPRQLGAGAPGGGASRGARDSRRRSSSTPNEPPL